VNQTVEIFHALCSCCLEHFTIRFTMNPFLALAVLCVATQFAEGKQEPDSVPLFQYYIYSTVSDNFVGAWTTEKGEFDDLQLDGKPGKVEDYGIVGYIYPTEKPGTVALRRYFSARDVDFLYTTSPSELGDGAGEYKFQKIQGWVLKNAADGAVPWHRFFDLNDVNHHYVTDRADVVSFGGPYVEEGNSGFIFSP
jgi:hypothetical protein